MGSMNFGKFIFNAFVCVFYFYSRIFYINISILITNFINNSYIRFTYRERLDVIDGSL